MNAFGEILSFFLLICAVVAIVCTLARDGNWKWIAREALHFFGLMVAGIFLFSGIVYILEWIFIRKL
jgi:uncharacterized PurR-regulated membrane protein YhhQ (DUF165 family)